MTKRKVRPPKAPPLPPPVVGSRHSNRSGTNSLDAYREEVLAEIELDRIWIVFWMVLASLVVMLVSLTPVLKRCFNPGESAPSTWDRWIYLLLFFAIAQLMYAIYFVQLPTWFSARASALLSLTLACVYASGLALFSFAKWDSVWVTRLELIDEQQLRTPAQWCLAMLCLLLPLMFYQAKVSLVWRKQEASFGSVF
ncbi:MAG: hypothetical protein GY768_27330 [Planctomycetaceae bacterium]|nr:hypothetical protein [Planctomycetaceae bacterium]